MNVLETFAKQAATRPRGTGGAGRLRGVIMQLHEIDMGTTLQGCSEGVLRGMVMSGANKGKEIEVGCLPIKNGRTPKDFNSPKSMDHAEAGSAIMYLDNFEITSNTEEKMTGKSRWTTRFSNGIDNDVDLVVNEPMVIEPRRVSDNGEVVNATFNSEDYSDVVSYRAIIFASNETVTAASYDDLVEKLTVALTTGTCVMMSAVGTSENGDVTRISTIGKRIWDRDANDYKDPQSEAKRLISFNFNPENDPDAQAALEGAINSGAFVVDITPGTGHAILPEACKRIMKSVEGLSQRGLSGIVSDPNGVAIAIYGAAVLKALDQDEQPLTGRDRNISKIGVLSAPVPITALGTPSDPNAGARYWEGLRASREEQGNTKPTQPAQDTQSKPEADIPDAAPTANQAVQKQNDVAQEQAPAQQQYVAPQSAPIANEVPDFDSDELNLDDLDDLLGDPNELTV